MDYEKKYKDALERAKIELNADTTQGTKNVLMTVFHELKESEDERIKESLMQYIWNIYHREYCPPTPSIETCDKWIAWLEKQGEPADKVEPKFKVGDWIIDKQGIVHQIEKVIENVTNNTFAYDLVGGGYFNEEVKSCRLWNIGDAKDGDVLYSLDSKQPFIFKHRKPNEQAAVYCGINTYGKFFIGNTKDCVITTDKYIPADKFQRDLLFKKIEEAGYQWDAKNKELKLLISNGGDFESNNSKQKPTWSDKDEEILKNLIDYFSLDDGLSLPCEETIDWLKSLKERLL